MLLCFAGLNCLEWWKKVYFFFFLLEMQKKIKMYNEMKHNLNKSFVYRTMFDLLDLREGCAMCVGVTALYARFTWTKDIMSL